MGRLPHDVLQIAEGITAKALILRCSKINAVVIKASDLPVVAVNKNCIVAYQAFIYENIIVACIVAWLMAVQKLFTCLGLHFNMVKQFIQLLIYLCKDNGVL